MDVINAAKKISEAGSKLDKLCRQIADQVNNVQLQITQGSHSDWKTWTNGKAFSSQGKVREF